MSRSSAFWTRKRKRWPTSDVGSPTKRTSICDMGQKARCPITSTSMPALVGGDDDPLHREAGLGGLDDGARGRSATLALPRLTTTPRSPPFTTTPSMMSPALELELALVVLQLDRLDHPVGEAGAELEEGHVLADLEDLAGHLLAGLEAAAAGAPRPLHRRTCRRRSPRPRTAPRERGEAARRGEAGAAALAGAGVASRLAAIARAAVATGTAGRRDRQRPPAPPGRRVRREGGASGGGCDGADGAGRRGRVAPAVAPAFCVGQALPERASVLDGGRGAAHPRRRAAPPPAPRS